jgi:hypothetical protein
MEPQAPATSLRKSITLLENTKNFLESPFIEILRKALDGIPQRTNKMTEKNYKDLYDQFERIETETNILTPLLEQINNLVKDINGEKDEIQKLIPEIKKTLNNYKLKFGLQGQVKQMLRNTNPEENGMDEYQRELVFQPYNETPYNKGGKTNRKNKKSKKRRNRKSMTYKYKN